jgi:hypothetical protein
MSKSILIGTLAALAVAAVLVVLWTGPRQKPENLQVSTQQWREDLQFLARELPKRHASAFHFTPRERFEKAVADLDSRLANADADTAWVGLQRLVSLVGDAHTYLQTPQDSASDLPIDIAQFGEEYRIVSVDPELESTLGARVTKVGDVPIARVAQPRRTLSPTMPSPLAVLCMAWASLPTAISCAIPSPTTRVASSR